MNRVIFLGCLAVLSLAHAQTVQYQVDDRVLIFPEQVKDALALWQAVEGGNVTSEEREDATTIFSVDDDALLAPDVASLTLSERSDTSLRRIILNSNRQQRQHALLYEWGKLLELNDATTGVMNPRIDPSGTLQELSASDEAALRELERYVKEDLNRDGAVDFYDLLILAENFSREGSRLGGDLNDDGIINQADVTILRAAYQFLPPSQNAPNNQRQENQENDVLDDAFPANDLPESPNDNPSDNLNSPAPEENAPTGQASEAEEPEATETENPTENSQGQ